MRAYRTQNISAIPFKRKESRLRRSNVLLYFHSFILLKGIQVQERKFAVCNQPSSSNISGFTEQGREEMA